MARIDVLPSIEIIRGFKGILDFYLWKGLPCVRAWPSWRPARQSDPSKAAALLFGAIVKAYSLLGHAPLEAYRADAKDHNRTARDIMVSGVYGNLHEASMSDFLTLLTQCRDFLSNLQAVLNALDSLSLDELDVNVEASVLPPLAATTTNQATMIAALQKLDDLQDALQSKALDRLLVRGMDQLYSFLDALPTLYVGNPSGDDGFVETEAVAAGQIWHLTALCIRDDNRLLTKIEYVFRRAAADFTFDFNPNGVAAATWWPVKCDLWLRPGDTIRLYCTGCQATDTMRFHALGDRMTKET